MPQFELVPAGRGQCDCIDALMQLYHYDASEWFPLALEPNGRYAYRPVDRLWDSANSFPFLIQAAGELCGFAVVDKEVVDAGSDWNMGYFFVVRRHRGRGLGREVAHELFRRYKGRWEVYQVAENQQAITFWRKVIQDFAGSSWREAERVIDGRPSVLQSFVSV